MICMAAAKDMRQLFYATEQPGEGRIRHRLCMFSRKKLVKMEKM